MTTQVITQSMHVQCVLQSLFACFQRSRRRLATSAVWCVHSLVCQLWGSLSLQALHSVYTAEIVASSRHNAIMQLGSSCTRIATLPVQVSGICAECVCSIISSVTAARYHQQSSVCCHTGKHAVQ